MTENNIYATPEAKLTENLSSSSVIQFFATSQTKLLVLFIATLGAYPIYWFYKHWKFQQERTGEKITPVLRAIFYIFFTHSLFKKIETASIEKEITISSSAGVFATIFVISTIVSNILDRIFTNTESFGAMDYAGLLILGVLVWPLYVMQGVANKVNEDPKGELNSSYSVYNYIFIFLGSIFWIFIAIELLQLDVSFIFDMFGQTTN